MSLTVRVTVCSLYLLPEIRSNIEDVIVLLDQLPPHFTVMGDFSAHTMAWGSVGTDSRGQRLADLLNSLNILFFNGGSSTHFCAASILLYI